MNIKQHKKMYKAGKQWLVASLMAITAGLMMGTTVHADTTSTSQATSQVETTQVAQQPVATANTITSQAAATNTANYGNLDHYSVTTSDSAEDGHLFVSGWHATDASQTEPYHYYLIYDNTTNKEINRQKATSPVVNRDDVQRAYPNVANSLHSGFSEKLYIPYAVVANGDRVSVISRYSDDSIKGEGNHTDYWFGPLSFDQGNHGHLDSVKVNNGQITVAGWNATNKNFKRPNHFIIAYDATQHREIARKIANTVIRNDVANAYPTITDAIESGFSTSFDLNPAFLTDEIQFVSRWSASTNGDQDYVDYWFAPQRLFNNEGNYGSLDAYRLSDSKAPDYARFVISGWHAASASMVETHPFIIVFDRTLNKEIGRSPINAPVTRNDVAKAYPNVYGSERSGFELNIDIPYSSFGHQISVVARYSDDAVNGEGNHTDYWFAPMTFDMGNYAHLDQATTTNGQINVQGWHATNQVAQGGVRRYHTIIAYDVTKGREIDRQSVDLNDIYHGTIRNDVARVYPHVFNADISGFNVNFNLAPEFAHDQIRFISRWSATADANENFVDYWFAPQTFSYQSPNTQPTQPQQPTNNQSIEGVGEGHGHLDKWTVFSSNGQANRAAINVQGWRVSQFANSKSYHDLIVWDNSTNREWSHVTISNPMMDFNTIQRPDIAAIYGNQYPAALNSGFNTSIILGDGFPWGHDFSLIVRYATDENGSNPSDLTFHLGRINSNMITDNF